MLNSWMNTHTGQFPKMWACGMGMMTKNDKDPALINNVNLRLEGLVHRVRISNARVFVWLLRRSMGETTQMLCSGARDVKKVSKG